MLFKHCLVTNSICGPSRAAVLTGKYSHKNGFLRNGDRFDGTQDTVAKRLKQAGYQTAVIGKWHLETDPTGFDYWQILPGQGVYYNPPMIENGTRVRHKGYTTDVITELTLQWLETKRDRAKPFLLMCQHKAPHRPWEPSLDKLTMYEDVTIPEPPTLFDDYSGRTSAARDNDMTIAKTMNDQDLKLVTPNDLDADQRKTWNAFYEPRNEAFRKLDLKGDDLVRWKYQRYIKDYLRCVSSVDDSVGRLLGYLDRTGQTENTVVIYASDQGFYLGEHGWFDKRWIYEESLHTPLLVRWPRVTKAGSSSESLVSNLDFAETFLDIAGQPIPAAMQGRSFAPLLRGEKPADWRKSYYYHYYEYPVPHRVRPHDGVRTDRHKLIHFYQTDEWELYDLEKDPRELRSVADDPSYARVLDDLKAELSALRTRYEVPPNDATPAKQGAAAAKKQATAPASPGSP
jgi:arylsulfatase A-like enzyme